MSVAYSWLIVLQSHITITFLLIILESFKIALPDQSENPALDELWRATALDWEPVKDTEVSYLRNIESENMPGCLQYIEVRNLDAALVESS